MCCHPRTSLGGPEQVRLLSGWMSKYSMDDVSKLCFQTIDTCITTKSQLLAFFSGVPTHLTYTAIVNYSSIVDQEHCCNFILKS